jgi:pimeloyl-ACP methyl ester carboxylesterase
VAASAFGPSEVDLPTVAVGKATSDALRVPGLGTDRPVRSGAMERLRRPVAVVIVCAALAAGCTLSEAPDAATPSSTQTPTRSTPSGAALPDPPPLDWHDCRDGAECATLVVPLDYDDPTAGTVDLAVARIPADDEDERIGSLILNPGGPGGSGIEALLAGIGAGLGDEFDLVSWDPRGVGDSRPLRCARDESFFRLDPDPDDASERAALERAAQAVAAECAAADPALLRTLDTSTAARDLELLRRALHDGPLNYFGFSYGTHIGLEYANLFPDQIRAMTLDGVVDPRETPTEMLTGQAIAIEQVLGDNLALFREVAEQLEREPLLARGREVGPGLLGVAAFASVYGPTGEAQLRRALEDALDGDGDGLLSLADQYIDASAFAPYLGVLCVDGARPQDIDAWWAFVDATKQRAPDLGASVANEVIGCAYWPVPPVEPEPIAWSPSLPPILLVASTEDAATPLDDAERVHAALPNSALVVREGAGHTSFGASRCIDRIVRSYFVELETPAEGTTCES